MQKSLNELKGFARKSKVVQSLKMLFVSHVLVKKDTNVNMDLFNQIDLNDDGVISFEKFLEFQHKAEPGMSDEDVRKVFAKLDQDGNGVLDYLEFTAAFVSFNNTHYLGQIRYLFSQIDKNKNGQISFAEIKDYLGQDPEIIAELEKMHPMFGEQNEISLKQFEELIIKYEN